MAGQCKTPPHWADQPNMDPQLNTKPDGVERRGEGGGGGVSVVVG